MKSILFIVPMHISWDSFANPAFFNIGIKKGDGKYYNIPRTDLPLGPISISAYLKKYMDIHVELIDLNAEVNAIDEIKFNDYESLCRDFLQGFKEEGKEFDFIGISSLFSPSYDNFMSSARVAREVWPNAIIIGGGNIPTNSYSKIFLEESSLFDGLCYGEGEKPMLHLLEAKDPLEYFESSKSWITKNKLTENILFEPEHDFIEDLDEIPFFDYDLCDFDKHEANQVVASYHSVKKSRNFHIMTSRGCPFKCTFCASHKTHGRDMRYHSLERVKADFTRLANEYDAETVVFQDDHLMADKKRVYGILEIIKNLGLKSVYQNGLTLYSLDRPMLEAFYDAGVRHLVLPVESGSEKVLRKQMRKPLKMKISERVARDCRDLGIYTNTNILIGMPGETKEDLEDARRNLKDIQTNWFNIACASPIVGSEMHEISIANGYIQEDVMGSDFRQAVITTEDFTSEFINAYQYYMNLDLNFVNNQDIKAGNYEWGVLGLANVLTKKEDHAFAHYYLSHCYEKLGEQDKADYHYSEYLKEVRTPFWAKYAYVFGLPGVDDMSFDQSDLGLISEILDIIEKYQANALSQDEELPVYSKIG